MHRLTVAVDDLGHFLLQLREVSILDNGHQSLKHLLLLHNAIHIHSSLGLRIQWLLIIIVGLGRLRLIEKLGLTSVFQEAVGIDKDHQTECRLLYGDHFVAELINIHLVLEHFVQHL